MPLSDDSGTATLFLRRDKLQKITNLTFENGTQPGKNINIQSGDFVIAIVIDLSALHFSLMT